VSKKILEQTQPVPADGLFFDWDLRIYAARPALAGMREGGRGNAVFDGNFLIDERRFLRKLLGGKYV